MFVKGILLDLDGTVYWGDSAVEGAAEFVEWIKEQGLKYLFVTNRANRRTEEIRDSLRAMGIPCELDDILTSAQATALYLESGSVFVVGEEGLNWELEQAGLVITDDNPDYVVVSFDRGFTYDKMKKACRLIDDGAKFIATNPDMGLRTENGITPGTGAIVAAVSAGCGLEPVIVGKPEKLIFELAVKKMGLSKDEVVAVGDNVAIDIPAGVNAGIRTVLLLTGISNRADLDGSAVKPDWVADDYRALREVLTFGQQC